VVLFVVWANMDSWFVLGLGAVALVWLGRVLDEKSRRGFAYLIAWLLLAAVCLINPSGVGAFALPPGTGVVAGRQLHCGSISVSKVYLAQLAPSPAGLAYFILIALGLLSFVMNRPRWCWQWFVPWLGLALLSAIQVRAIPFFAVVAGPVLAWNLQLSLARRLDPQQRPRLIWRPGSGVGRGLTVGLGPGPPLVCLAGLAPVPPV